MIQDLTKQQAYEEMKAGKKITHSLFGAEEFLYMIDDKMYEEAGYSFEDGWKMRTEDKWLTGWKIYQDIPYLLDALKQAQEEIESNAHMLDLANKALERAGSAARFGIKCDIPHGAFVFRDTAESMASIPDECGCEALHRAQAEIESMDSVYIDTARELEQAQAEIDRMVNNNLSYIKNGLVIADGIERVEIENRQLKERERVLREALENILNHTEATCVVLTSSEIIDVMQNIAKKAIGQEKA